MLVVIPVRGGSKGIPRKNVRLLAGQPLFVYTLRNAEKLASFFTLDYVVDTDDDEIADIASQYGAMVVQRPKELGYDNVTLDPVIENTVRVVEEKKDKKYEIVITMQATSPLLKYTTIKDAIESFITENCDTMISGVNIPHLAWTKENGEYIAKYKERVNRQQLEPHYKETGGFLITKREFVNKNSRIGKKVSIYEVNENEAIDIDSEWDWKLCENILSTRKILLRADGEENLGMGHIYRTLSLAYHLTGNKILFVTRRDMRMGAKKIEDSFFPVRFIDSDEDTLKIVDEFCPDIVINDILNTKLQYMQELRKKVKKIINFEDRGVGASIADVIINALYSQGKLQNEYTGFEYFFIRDEFLTASPKKFMTDVENIVVLFGGADPSNLTKRIFEIMKRVNKRKPNIKTHIITGFGYKHKNELKSNEKYKIYVHNDVKRVSKYMAEADMAITAQGRTIFELACMGVPSIVLAENNRELEHDFASISNGFINLGLGDEQEDDTIEKTIMWLIDSSGIRKQMHDLMLEKDFMHGQERVLKLILGD